MDNEIKRLDLTPDQFLFVSSSVVTMLWSIHRDLERTKTGVAASILSYKMMSNEDKENLKKMFHGIHHG